MKVILLQDVPKVGHKYEVKTIADGYVRNFLLPKGLVQIATDKALGSLEEKKKVADAERKIHEDLLVKNINGLEGAVITIEEKANEQGHLFAGIHAEEIARAIKEQTHLDIAPEHISLEEHIKEVGEHEIVVSAHDKKATCKLVVGKRE